MTFENKIEKQCNIITKTNREFWETSNKAMLELTCIIEEYEDASINVINDIFNHNVFSMLQDPIKHLLCDLRSQQVRDTCLFLNKLAEITKDHMKFLLREIFSSLLDGIKNPNKVMSSFVDATIIHIIKHSTWKPALTMLINEIKDNKAKRVREHCFEYINEILLTWNITENEADRLCDTIAKGLEDASVRAREISRLAYLNLFQLHPKKSEKVKANINPSLRNRLIKAENDYVISQKIKEKEFVEEIKNPIAVVEEGRVTRSRNNSQSIPIINEVKELSLEETPKIISLRARRQSYDEVAATSIQAILRGNLYRKMSMGGLPGKTSTYFNSPNPSQKQSPTKTIDEMNSINSTPSSTPIKTLTPTLQKNSVIKPSTPLSSSKLIKNSHSNMKSKSNPNTPSSILNNNDSDKKKTLRGGGIKRIKSASSTPADKPRSPSSPSGLLKVDLSSYSINNKIDLNKKNIPNNDNSPNSINENIYPSHLILDQLVQIRGRDLTSNIEGIIKFIGHTEFSSGYWIGIVLIDNSGKNDGSVNGVNYFTCDEGKGLFVRASQIINDISHKFSPNKKITKSAPTTPVQQPIPIKRTTNVLEKNKEKQEKVISLLKVKISSMINLLNQQLQIAEEFDNTNKRMNCNEVILDLISLNESEMEMTIKFNEKMEMLNKLL
jgi:hypothetical protein